MQITDMLNQYNRNIANGVEISGGTQGIKQIVSSLQEMAVGNVFEGNVNSLEDGVVTLGLSDGKTIQAKLDSGVSVRVGESMFFQVKSNNGAQIAIRPFSNGVATNPTLLNALEAANLQVNAKNLTMVNTMMEQSMSIDKQSLMNMAKLMMGNDGMDVSSMVQMAKLGIPVTGEMAAQFENYKSDQYAILNQLESVMEMLPEQLANGSLSQNELLELNQQIIKVFLGEGRQGTDGLPGEANAQSVEQPGTLIQNPEQSGTVLPDVTPSDGSVQIQEQPVGTAQNMEQSGNILQNIELVIEESDVVQQNLTESGVTKQTGIQAEMVSQNAEQMETAAQNGQPTEMTPQNGQQTETISQNVEQSGILSQSAEEPAIASQKMESPGITPENSAASGAALRLEAAVQDNTESFVGIINRADSDASGTVAAKLAAAMGKEITDTQIQTINREIATGNLSKETLQLLEQAFSGKNPITRQALSELVTTKEYRTMVRNLMEQAWLLKPEELKTEHKVNELYNRLEHQLSQVEKVLKNFGQNTPQLADTAANVRNNIQFMNHLNQTYAYVQIPLKLAGQNAHSDLYVYTDKRKVQEKDGELTAFLHLDLDHLGSTDVSIKLHQKKVTTNFYLADDISYQLISEHMDILEKRLEEKGYYVKIQVTNQEEKVNFVEDLLKQGAPSAGGMVHRYSFDVRA